MKSNFVRALILCNADRSGKARRPQAHFGSPAAYSFTFAQVITSFGLFGQARTDLDFFRFSDANGNYSIGFQRAPFTLARMAKYVTATIAVSHARKTLNQTVL